MIITGPQQDYELIDSGDRKKLERYGSYVLSRPDPQALWKPTKGQDVWGEAHAVFVRDGKDASWKKTPSLPTAWEINFGGLVFEIRMSSFKHTGLFPEQLGNWTWLQDIISLSLRERAGVRAENLSPKILNLFGYTGGATLACAKAGSEVCHVDGSKMAIDWARKNQKLSGLDDKPIRWILDDALVFLRREIKRGVRYDGIIMDPPAFGHGPKGEVWKIEEQFTELMDLCIQVLSDDPILFLINGYASGFSPIAYQNNLLQLTEKLKGSIETGELAIEESETKRLLPTGIFARWQRS